MKRLGRTVQRSVGDGEDDYFSGDQIAVLVCELLLHYRLSRNVFGILSLGQRFKYG